MRKLSAFRSFAALVVCVFAATQSVMCSGSDTPSACETADDCWNTPEAEGLGRCAPKEAACVRGACRIACPQLCEAVEPNVNPCREPALVCNQSSSGSVDLPFCAHAPIACESVDDCPVTRPSTAEAGEWTCEQGVCRFPGFAYVWE